MVVVLPKFPRTKDTIVSRHFMTVIADAALIGCVAVSKMCVITQPPHRRCPVEAAPWQSAQPSDTAVFSWNAGTTAITVSIGEEAGLSRGTFTAKAVYD